MAALLGFLVAFGFMTPGLFPWMIKMLSLLPEMVTTNPVMLIAIIVAAGPLIKAVIECLSILKRTTNQVQAEEALKKARSAVDRVDLHFSIKEAVQHVSVTEYSNDLKRLIKLKTQKASQQNQSIESTEFKRGFQANYEIFILEEKLIKFISGIVLEQCPTYPLETLTQAWTIVAAARYHIIEFERVNLPKNFEAQCKAIFERLTEIINQKKDQANDQVHFEKNNLLMNIPELKEIIKYGRVKGWTVVALNINDKLETATEVIFVVPKKTDPIKTSIQVRLLAEMGRTVHVVQDLDENNPQDRVHIVAEITKKYEEAMARKNKPIDFVQIEEIKESDGGDGAMATFSSSTSSEFVKDDEEPEESGVWWAEQPGCTAVEPFAGVASSDAADAGTPRPSTASRQTSAELEDERGTGTSRFASREPARAGDFVEIKGSGGGDEAVATLSSSTSSVTKTTNNKCSQRPSQAYQLRSDNHQGEIVSQEKRMAAHGAFTESKTTTFKPFKEFRQQVGPSVAKQLWATEFNKLLLAKIREHEAKEASERGLLDIVENVRLKNGSTHQVVRRMIVYHRNQPMVTANTQPYTPEPQEPHNPVADQETFRVEEKQITRKEHYSNQLQALYKEEKSTAESSTFNDLYVRSKRIQAVERKIFDINRSQDNPGYRRRHRSRAVDNTNVLAYPEYVPVIPELLTTVQFWQNNALQGVLLFNPLTLPVLNINLDEVNAVVTPQVNPS